MRSCICKHARIFPRLCEVKKIIITNTNELQNKAVFIISVNLVFEQIQLEQNVQFFKNPNKKNHASMPASIANLPQQF
jgi:hypothetical protein